jgi:hypothetical protein
MKEFETCVHQEEKNVLTDICPKEEKIVYYETIKARSKDKIYLEPFQSESKNA